MDMFAQGGTMEGRAHSTFALETFENKWCQPDMEKFKDKFQWDEAESILEFGSGNGNYTKNALMHYLPTDFEEFIGSDISPEMVECAKGNLIHPKVRFEVLDITCETIPPQYVERFNHIFSFRVLHTVPNTKRAFENIYKMLKPGGEAFLTFGERISTHEVFTELHNHPRWKKYRHGDYVADFYHYGNIEAALERMLREAGFTDHILEVEDSYDMMPSGQCFRDFVSDYNPVLPQIPEKDVEEYMDMFVERLLESSLYKVKIFKKGNHPLVYFDFKQFVVFARKPSPDYELMALKEYMEKYKNKFQWKDEESILEFGMGCGKNTKLGLVPYIPTNFKEFIGTDLSSDQVEIARSNFSHPKARIEQFDIVCDTIPAEYKGRFDHIFSFMVLQLVLNLRKAFQNILKMLKPGGEVFVTFSEKMPTNEAFMDMMLDRRWEQYGHEDYLTAFHYYDNVEEEFRKLLVETGFIDYDFEIEDKTLDFKNEKDFRAFALKMNPILPQIPAHELEEYKDIFVRRMRSSKMCFVKECEKTGRKTIHCRYKQIVLLARKPTPSGSPRGTYKESSFSFKKVE